MTDKTLLVMRHGKSDWSKTIPDFERPLNKRGMEAVPRMGEWLKEHSLIPDIIISSPAERARQTSILVCERLGQDPSRIVWDDRVYEAGLKDLLKVIDDHVDMHECIMLVGHNPVIDELITHLSAEYPPRSDSGKLMTTAAVAVLQFEEEISTAVCAAKAVDIIRPKER